MSAQESYNVSRLDISEESDDFAPFLWNDHLVFTSERHPKLFLIEYKDSKHNSGVSSLFKAKQINDTLFSAPDVLSKEFQSNHHDGPASFTSDGKYVYYSRPRDISNTNQARLDEKNFSAIYEAEWDGTNWKNITRLSFIDTSFIYTHPAISPDGTFIVFVSNLNGEKGRADLFISRKVNGQWGKPISLGNDINTKYNEFFPYIHLNGDFYFASNKKGDFDIYKCKFDGGSWSKPEALPSPINSKADDYSFYLNQNAKSGYFASNRDEVFDLYYFSEPDNGLDCDSLIEETFCYTFPQVSNKDLEDSPLVYQWTVNGEIPMPKDQISYCFPTEGRYDVRLNIYDTISQKVIFIKETYEFLVMRVEQPYIRMPDEIRVNEIVELDASVSHLPEFEPQSYDWDYGDGEKGIGVSVNHSYKHTGTYRISLTIKGITSEGDSTQLCSYKDVEVTIDAELDQEIPFNEPLDLAAFIKLIEYEKLPEDQYYLNLIKGSDHVFMIHLFDSTLFLAKDDDILKGFSDTSKIHVLQEDDIYSYYYGSTYDIRDAYKNLVESWDAGFLNASVKNFKYTKLKSEDYFLTPIEEDQRQFSIVLERSDEPIDNYKDKFKKLPERVGEVEEKFVEGEGYFYVVGDAKNKNEAFSIFSELQYEGFKSIRIKEFKENESILFDTDLIASEKTSSYMIELFTVEDYLAEDDSMLQVLSDLEIVAIRTGKKKVGYFTEGGTNLLEAKKNLEAMKERGFEDALIRKFEYEKLNDDGYFVSKIDEGDFTYILSFDSTSTTNSSNEEFTRNLLGYKILQNSDSEDGESYYEVDIGNNLPEAVLLTRKLNEDSLRMVELKKMRYEPLNDDEFFIDKMNEGDEQFVLVLGAFKKQQDIYETFKGFSSCHEIREFYDELNKQFLYIVGGYESLEEVFLEKEKCEDMGMENVRIQRFVYDPLDPDKFYLKAVNEEQEVFRITLSRTSVNDVSEKATDEKYDALRTEGELIDSYDQESDEYVVSMGNAKSLPLALNYLGDVMEQGYSSVKVQRYIYSSMDHDRFAIRDLDHEDRYACVELFHSDTLLSPNDPILRKLSRRFPISYSYNVPTKDYVYVIGPLEDVEAALSYLEKAKAEGFADARIMAMIYKTLQQDEFYLEEMEDINMEFVITVLQTKNEVDTSNSFFNKLPKDVKLDKVYDGKTGFYYYLARDFSTIDEANNMFAKIKASGYPNARLEKMKYDYLKPDEFTLETLSDVSSDYTISLFRADEKLGSDHPMFSDISQEAPVYEFYNYKTKKFIYTLGKIEGMTNVFDKMDLAKKYGFNNASIDKFVYSALNPDHFTLIPMDEDLTLFTIIIAQSEEELDPSSYASLENLGYTIREKYVPSKGIWTYSIGLTENIAEANRIVEEARDLGFENAKISRFIYEPLNEDSYYLTPVDDIETTFMLEIKSSDDKLNIDDEEFENVKDVYNVSEVFDPIDKKYKYYAGNPLEDQEEAEAFRNELLLMGYDGVKVSKFIYTALKVDEYYLEKMEDDGDFVFVLESKEEEEEIIEESEVKEVEFFVYFGFDQYFLTKEAVAKLSDFYRNNYSAKYQILLEGYTDSIGDADYNMWLSKKRAMSVKKYLLSLGVPEESITVDPKGETSVIYNLANKEDYKKSRRVLVRSHP